MMPTLETADCRLKELSRLSPDAARSARTRERCRAALQRRARVQEQAVSDRSSAEVNRPSAAGARAWRDGLAGLAGMLCLLYLLSLIATTVRLQATLR